MIGVFFKAFQWTIYFESQNIQYGWAPKWSAMRTLPDYLVKIKMEKK